MTHPHDHDYEGPDPFAQAKEMREQAEQELLARKHEIRRLFTELKQEHLSTLSDLLGIIVSTGEAAPVNAAHFHALSKVYLETRFGICSACEKNHDLAIQELTPEIGGRPVLGMVPDPDYPVGILPLQAHPASVAASTAPPDLKVGETGLLSVQQLANMEKYRLDDLREEETNKLLGFVCIGYPERGVGCGMQYPTIEDRMLRSPEDCSNCHIRAAHG